MLLFELLDFFICDLHFCFVIHFIGKDHDLDVTSRVFFYFIKPDRDAEETLPIRQVKDYDDTIRSFVISIGDGAVSFLTGCVPNL
jgi:hypothetical protein